MTQKLAPPGLPSGKAQIDRLAPAARTLYDVFAATVELHGPRTAIDAQDASLTYDELARAVQALADSLREQGVGPGDRVGVHLQSGSSQLYVAILGVLCAGAAYIPVDADDPPARTAGIWKHAGVCGVLEEGLRLQGIGPARGAAYEPSADDDAWIIFTSGSTGRPKGVAVSHRSAVAFVQAEKRLWSVHPEDRVLGGLSVAFDASCEEMWLAWANGAALVPAPRALVRSGVDVGPWLAQREISVISTVPTLAAMWDEHTLAGVRLLILGGEACSSELGWRLADGCEVWNTYGPTEATVVSTAARILPGKPVTIGWPLEGWKIAVVDESGRSVPVGEPGELVIGGVGLGRYLDQTLDAERYAGLPVLGWERAYRSGDIVRDTAEGLQFIGRRDHQVKLAGRRLELGEVEAQLSAVAGVRAAAAAVQSTAAHNKVLVGYVVGEVNPAHVRAAVAELLPDGLAPVVVVLEEMPLAPSGKVDRKALPWPPSEVAGPVDPSLSGTAAWLARCFADQLGPVAIGLDTDFFACGGSSLAAAKLVSVLRERFPSVAVADVYEHRLLEQLAVRLDELTPAGEDQDGRLEVGEETTGVEEASGEDGLTGGVHDRAKVRDRTLAKGALPTRWRRFAAMQIAGVLVLTALAASQWVLGAFAYGNIESDGLPHVGWVWLIGAWLLLASPMGRLGLAVAARRLLLGELRPGRYPRDSWLACRVWFLERLGEYCNLTRMAGTPFSARYARLMGADVDRDARIASMPTLTSLVHIGPGATVESQVDLHGWWIDGQELVIDELHIGAGASVGSRTLLAPGSSVGEGAEIEPGSVVCGAVPAGEHWGGSPARHLGSAGERWPSQAPPPSRDGRVWRALYSASLMWEGLLVLLALAPGVLLLVLLGAPVPSLSGSFAVLLGEAALVASLSTVALALLVALTQRMVWKLVRPGWHGGGGALSWALWFSGDLNESSGAILFPLYASLYTRGWLRLMGIRVGRGTEISTSTGLNPLVSFGELSHATDDVGFCGARSRGGWLHLEAIEVGSRTFLGPGAVLREGTRLGDDSLIGALTLAPRRPEHATSWLGVPAFELPRVRAAVDPARTVCPPRRVVLARALMDAIRILGPNALSLSIGLFDLLVLDAIGAHLGIVAMIAFSPLVVLGSGVFSAALAVATKWTLIGRYRTSEHPLWSFFVWRDEIVNTAHEQLAGEWLLRFAIGTPLMSLYLRAMGGKVGRGVWCETTAVTEYDVVTLEDGCAINRGSCLMTHVFQDRLLSIGPTSIGPGATMGPTSAVLPDTTLGAGACIGAHSVVLRGERLPPATRWHGAPVVSCE
ncbi:MAG TPA: Pls/PosA family non-ribosomal peptide synthetase [Solirubrobacteraceae bacterium]|jgi:non-ribosomal peptide synthetase-like protein|nr:Pls/PosA family non-ribosomal peptide synthetase [Solirubrobacteraceae bacterium]